MRKLYNTQDEIATNFSNFLLSIFPRIRKSQLKILPFIIIGMILSESVVASDIAKSLKHSFSLVQLDSVIRRIKRFLSNKFFEPYSFFESIILFVIRNYKKSHSDNRVHISFDHMFSKQHYTILLFSLRIGRQGIPIYFRCFKGIYNSEAFLADTIINGINSVVSYFKDSGLEIIFLADRWFNYPQIFNHIISLNSSFCIRLKPQIKLLVFDEHEGHYISTSVASLFAYKRHSNFIFDAFIFNDNPIKINLAISKRDGHEEPWVIATNSHPSRAVRDYGYRFGAIETIFKNQKSNGFFLESTVNASLKYFESLYCLLCISVLFLTVLGTEFSKNSRCYKNVTISTHKFYRSKNKKVRVISLFNTGLTLFHLAFNSSRYIRLPVRFILYDV